MATMVTGGSGLIGSRIVRDLVREGETVIIYDLNIDEEALNYVLTAEDMQSVILVQGDILDYDRLCSACDENDVDQVIHTASMMGNADKPLLATHVNTGGMMCVLELARTRSIKKVVYTSTNGVFSFNATAVIPNDSKYAPESTYGCTKVFNELAAEMYYKVHGVDIMGIRVGAMIFGEYQRRGWTASIATEAVYNPARGIPGHIPCNDEELGWLYCDDVALAHIKALHTKREPSMAGIYNIMGTLCSIQELVNFVKHILPDAQIEIADKETGENFWRLDTSVTEREIGYRPTWNLWDAWKRVIVETRRSAGLPVDNLL